MLSLKLGRTYQELLDTLTHEELLTYLAYNELQPFSEFRDDERFAMLATVMHNTHIGDKRDIAKIQDFMLRSKPKENKKMSADEMLNNARAFASQWQSKGG